MGDVVTHRRIYLTGPLASLELVFDNLVKEEL